MKTLDKYLLWAITYIVAWSVAFFIAWLVLRIEPSTLEGCILAPAVVEMVACAFVQHGKTKYGGTEDDTRTDSSETDQP